MGWKVKRAATGDNPHTPRTIWGRSGCCHEEG
jgi:hypothetical protein